MITILAFIFVLGVLVFVHELGHFLAAKRVGHPRPEVPARFQPDHRELPPRRHRIRHRRAAARRLRQDGRREPRGGRARRARQPDRPAGRVPRQDEVAALPGPDHGPDHEPAARGHPHGGGESPRHGKGLRTKTSRSSSASWPRDRRRRRRTFSRATRSCRSAATASTPGISSSTPSASKPDREVDIGLLRNGLQETRKVTPAAGRPEPLRIRRHRRAAERPPARRRDLEGQRRGDGPASRPTTWCWRVDGKPITFSYQLKEAIAKHPEQQITMSILRGGQTQTIQATPARQGDEGLLGIRIGDDTFTDKPPRRRGASPARDDEHRDVAADFQDAGRPVHAAKRRPSS